MKKQRRQALGIICAGVVALWNTGCASSDPQMKAQPAPKHQPLPQNLPPAAPKTQTPPADPPPAPEAVSTWLDKAHAAWSQRAKQPKLEEAIALFEAHLKEQQRDSAAWVSLAQAYHFFASGFLSLGDDDDAMLSAYERGVQAGERALMLDTAFASALAAGQTIEEAFKSITHASLDSLHWYTANLVQFSLLKGYTTTLFYKQRIVAALAKIVELDPAYRYGVSYSELGALYAATPGFVGGDLNRAKDYFDKALAISDLYFATKVLYAQTYAVKAENKALFTQLLNDVAGGDANGLPHIAPEQELERKKAKQLLGRLDELF